MKPELLDESEVEMWRRHPITQKVFKRLKEVLDSRVKKMLRSEETIDRAAMNAAETRSFTQATKAR